MRVGSVDIVPDCVFTGLRNVCRNIPAPHGGFPTHRWTMPVHERFCATEVRMKEMNIQIVQVPGWERFGWLRHGFSTRRGGVSQVYGEAVLNLGFTRDDDPDHVRENRRLLAAALSSSALSGPALSGSAPPAPPAPLVTIRQVHGTTIHRAEGVEDSPVDADGLLTSTPGLLLGVQAADCVPVLLADVRQRVVAAIHAGWRGTAAGIVGIGIAQMQQQFASRPEDLVAAIGPSIGPCCYQVGDEVKQAFGLASGLASGLIEEDRLNLWEANRRQLLAAGLPADAITVIGECTGCTLTGGQRKYFSHRMEAGFTGRAMGVIGIAADPPQPKPGP